PLLRRTPAKAGVTAGFANANHHLLRLPRNSGLLSWSGLPGGIAVALALSSPAGPYREALATAACGIAILHHGVQGLSLGRGLSAEGACPRGPFDLRYCSAWARPLRGLSPPYKPITDC
ncbi:MAG TPA: hypothetical protein VGX95_13475, partial [Xanthobacteraceae bacterium]|nr:hypothetical protein [Xanthobacteraceae bacterium]